MASIYKEFVVHATPKFVWSAINDVGAIHTRLARGFVVGTVVDGDIRTVRFANGAVVQEQIVSKSEDHRRLVYRAIGGKSSHHNAFFQVFAEGQDHARILWVTDLLPDEVSDPVEHMVEAGVAAMKRTLEETYAASPARA